MTTWQVPTVAELEPGMEAIVVSEETISGANSINQGRNHRGLTPLSVLVVPVVGAVRGKLSSSDLRDIDAAAARQPRRGSLPAAAGG